MNKKIIIIPIIVIIGIFIGISFVDSPSEKDNVVFHATLL